MDIRHNFLQDINGIGVEQGHIVAVKYVWSSCVGEVTLKGLFNGKVYHSLDNKSNYQIIGHINKIHKDYRQDVFDWLQQYYSGKYQECPVQISVYKNIK